ncbi:MAG: hypothetical protein H0W62_14990 [Chitinophagales bacterium]|nr:hypothetical protein [Chitinophagales bacterium]
MKCRFICILSMIRLIASNPTNGQNISSSTLNMEAFGAGGAGAYVSLNYDLAFKLPIKNFKVAAEAGIAPGVWGYRVLRFPVRVSILYGKNTYHVELAENYIWCIGWTDNAGYEDPTKTVQHYFIPSIGLRIQDFERRALFFRFNVYPVNAVRMNNSFTSFVSGWPFNKKIPSIAHKYVPWIGVSAGYTFNRRHPQ